MNQKQQEKGSDLENWSSDGEFTYCRHNDCHFYMRKRGVKRRILCRIFNDRVELKCDSCGQISTFRFDKNSNFNTKVDESQWIPLESMIKEWEEAK